MLVKRQDSDGVRWMGITLAGDKWGYIYFGKIKHIRKKQKLVYGYDSSDMLLTKMQKCECTNK